uniref:Uncharacterized protein n=1 Tax=Nelumbo nucifera TaxID=4432 RepID=A0A822YN80_NELNU|nr:TPA_asm: hypothetical protein HUJ06_011326 [Nelumbo nucifera]
MRRLEASSRSSWRTSSATRSPTLNTLDGRLSPLWMSSMPSSDRVGPSTASVVDQGTSPLCKNSSASLCQSFAPPVLVNLQFQGSFYVDSTNMLAF